MHTIKSISLSYGTVISDSAAVESASSTSTPKSLRGECDESASFCLLVGFFLDDAMFLNCLQSENY